MVYKSPSILLLLLAVLVLVACDRTGIGVSSADTERKTVSPAECPQAAAGTHQLVYVAQGICFLYSDIYDVFQGEDGGLTLYVESLLNTEAPVASLKFEASPDRTLDEAVAERLASFGLPAGTEERITVGGEPALVLDNLPGQDLNRRLVTVHENLVYELIVSRIGPDYGAVGEQAEALYQAVVESFTFIAIEPEAPLRAGPECPTLADNATLYTNEVAGYCLLLPAGFQMQEISSAGWAEVGENEMAFYARTAQGVHHARLSIKVTDAQGQSLEEASSAHKREIDTAWPGSDVSWSFGYLLDGVAANQFDRVPGEELGRHLVMVHNGRLYTLRDPDAGAAYAGMETLYRLVLDSFSILWQS